MNFYTVPNGLNPLILGLVVRGLIKQWVTLKYRTGSLTLLANLTVLYRVFINKITWKAIYCGSRQYTILTPIWAFKELSIQIVDVGWPSPISTFEMSFLPSSGTRKMKFYKAIFESRMKSKIESRIESTIAKF